MKSMNEKEMKRVVEAPQMGAVDLSGEILSVELNADEEIVWRWMHQPDGNSFVSGDEIIKQAERSDQ